MNLSKIHHIAIIVSDYEAAKDFYVNKLGLSVIRENYRPERKDWKLDLRVNEHTELEIFAEENPPKRVNRPEGNAGGVFEENRAGVLPAGRESAGSDLRALHGE